MSLANDKFLDLEIIAKKNVHNCLTYLTYVGQKNKVQEIYIKSKFKK